MGEQLERETTVVFADILGGADLIAKAGDSAAVAALGACLAHLKKAAEGCGGRVVNRSADKLMVLLPTPDAAADAAAAMHGAMETLPPAGDTKLTLGIGFHHGPVIQKDNEVWGDTVNLAAQLVEQAANGQIITTRETASHLSPLYRAWMRKLYSIDIKGRSGQVALCELVWRADDNATLFAKNRNTRVASTTLTVVYRDKTIVRRRDRDSITIGRDPNCGIPIADDQASRLHCTIERRQDKWFLIDHSTNGTYVSVDGADDVLVQREEFTLTGRGRIACGQPSVSTKEIVAFTVE
ncbi:MAG TPA: adenylate/guanylate cyclase domain-containing protein [Burkholderiales bacterium]|nr:adenylate/guanylate cyclase domain-containing protein [Burkholderiales bacterium]